MAAKKQQPRDPNSGNIVQNRRARHDYDILQRYEAGIALTGSEIKSVREHRVQLQGSYARVRDDGAWLVDAHIAPYANAGYAGHNPTRERRLLLHKKEIDRIREQVGAQGLTLIPLSMYFKRGRAKVELGVARGLKRYDKRERIAERETTRQLERAVRSRA